MMDFSRLTLTNLFRDCRKIDYSHQISIHPYYNEFIAFFKEKKHLDFNDIVVAAHMVYGWMPTMLRLDTSEIEAVLKVLNRVKYGHLASLEELGLIRSMMNNSMVGPSKLLHFIHPDNYAIWDSRIYRYIFGTINQNQIAKADNYHDYLNVVKTLTANNRFLRVHDFVQESMNVSYSKLRTAEIVMFETDKRNGKRIT